MKSLFRPMRSIVGALAAAAIGAAPAHAQISWTDWTFAGANTVTGTMMFNSTPVGVTYTGSYGFAELGCGIDYYSPNVYTGTGVPNAPGNCELIALSSGGAKTITFSAPVVNPVLAIVSWNGQAPITFNGPLQVVSSGCGYWGCGSISAAGSVLTTGGEAHGTVQMLGTYSSITFTDGSEYWHGITVGATSLAVSAVPEPASVVLTATGLLGLAAAARRRRSA